MLAHVLLQLWACVGSVFVISLTPCSNLEVAPTVEEKELRHIEGVAPAGESAEESDHYRPSIHPDVVSKLIRGELDKYKTDVRISIELQFFIHMWLEQRLLESFRADETCELVLMTAIYQGRRLPLGVINELTKPQAVGSDREANLICTMS